MSPWFLYVVECADSTYYTGIATDVERRVEEHNSSKKASKYTRARRPVVLKAFWGFENRSLASKAEYQFKKLDRQQKKERLQAFKDAQRDEVVGNEK